LQGVQRSYAQLASAKGIKLQLRVDDHLAAAHHFDPMRLSQILNNFTSNAIKFTEMGTVEIYAQHVAQQDGSEEICLGVLDSGCGISPEARARLFQHYEQGSAETARMYGGTGLGLSICRSLAELMGGSISVNSELGVGSNFQVILKFPVASAQAQRELQLQQARQETHENRSPTRLLSKNNKTISVLIVDDHPVNRALLSQQLEQLGVQVEAAAYGVVALSLWWTGNFDLVITDCHMPEMDGYELTRSIREMEVHDERPRIPVIAWTANVMVEEEARCLAAGMDDLLTKPTELATLRAMLIKWLGTAELLTVAEHEPSEPVLNLALDSGALQKIASNLSEQIEILQEFQQCNRDDIASLLADLEQGDAPAIASSAHRIKGACRMVGALELADLCLQIEQAAKQGNMAAVRAIPTTTTLQATVARLEAAIAKLAEA
jgi:CheY-like chemotaxis protein